jgi:hypothetical protein
MATRAIFIRQAGQTATFQASLVKQQFGGATSGGNMAAGRFTTGPSRPNSGLVRGTTIKR